MDEFQRAVSNGIGRGLRGAFLIVGIFAGTLGSLFAAHWFGII